MFVDICSINLFNIYIGLLLLLLVPLVFVDYFFLFNNINVLEEKNTRISGGLTAFNGCLNDGGRLLVNYSR